MTMSLSVYWNELTNEINAGMRGPLFPLSAFGLALYILLVLSNADYMRDMGAIGIPRNSSHVVYLLSTGMSLWLFFIWAWLFGQVTLRDKTAALHEVIGCAPVSLKGLIVARYLGACIVAFMLGLIMPSAMLLAPVLGWLGIVPEELIGQAPFLPILWCALVFILPMTLGIGALLLSTVLIFRSVAGPFAVAALLMLVWMIGLIIFKNGDISIFAATVLDPTGFSEAEFQTDRWPPARKIDGFLELSPQLWINRFVWCIIPLGIFTITLMRLKREHLVLEQAAKQALKESPAKPIIQIENALSPLKRPIFDNSWLRATSQEYFWHLSRSLNNWVMRLSLIILFAIGVGGGIFNAMEHGEGPMIPRAEFLLPFMSEFFFVFLLFMVAGFVGVLMRRDSQTGFDEMFDVTPAPTGVLVISKAMAAFSITIVFVLASALSAWVVMLIGSPSFSFVDPVIYQLLVVAPALLEVAAITILMHAVIRNSGAAHAMSMMFGFIAIVNYELNLVSFEPALIGIPYSVLLSSMSGWTPWIASLLTVDGIKVSFSLFLLALAWLLWSRGTDSSLRARFHAVLGRFREGAALLAAISVVCIAVLSSLIVDKLIIHGQYISLSEELKANAKWEKTWASKAATYEIAGGHVSLKIDPISRTVKGEWSLRDFSAANGVFTGSLPHGIELVNVTVNGEYFEIDTAYDQFAVSVEDCREVACDIELFIDGKFSDWPTLESQPWLHHSGVWMRARDVLSRLGIDKERILTAPLEREKYVLSKNIPDFEARSLSTLHGVAPAGNWSWEIRYIAPGNSTYEVGRSSTMLDFASAWYPNEPEMINNGDLKLYHHASHQSTAMIIAEEIRELQLCVEDVLNMPLPTITKAVHVPRGLGDIRVYHDVFWLPESSGWDVAEDGFGRQIRRQEIASALAKSTLFHGISINQQDGIGWYAHGIPLWVALECTKKSASRSEWIALQQRLSDIVIREMGAVTTPITTLAKAGNEKWVGPYMALTTLNIASQIGTSSMQKAILQVKENLKHGHFLIDSFEQSFGFEMTNALFGVPRASDTVVKQSNGTGVSITSERWLWAENEWVRIESGIEQALTNHEANDLIFDSWGGFEKTPADNVIQPVD